MKQEDALDYLLRKVSRAHTNKVNKVLEQYNMHNGQPILLRILSVTDGLPQSLLAKKMNIKPATISAMVKRMEKAGFVVRKRDAEDERISNVYITKAGKDINTKLLAKQDDMEEIVFKDFSEEEKLEVRGFLDRILKNINE